MRDRKWQQRITVGLGIILSFSMVIALILPLVQTQITNNQQVVSGTSTPRPTQPPPPDTSTITFDSTYLHASGLFTVAIPSSYAFVSEFNGATEAQLTMENSSAQSIMEVRVIAPSEGVSLDSTQGLGGQFTSDWLRSSWNRYTTWQEDARRVEDDRLIMDFSLSRGGQDYIARQIAYTDGTWIYMVRVVSPSNAVESMQYVLNNELATFEPIAIYQGEPLDWDAYFDDATNHILRFPGTWLVVDGVEGAPASIAGDNVQVRVETGDAVIDSADSASDYVAGLRSTITVLSVEEVEQYGASGYRVSYTQGTADGGNNSGVVLILNGADTSHIVNLLLNGVSDVDLNTVDVSAEGVDATLADARNSLDSFALLPELEID